MGRMATIQHHSRRGRPSKGERYAVSTMLYGPDAEKLQEIVEILGVTRSAYIEAAIKQALAQVDVAELRERYEEAVLPLLPPMRQAS